MRRAIDETDRRREIQRRYNEEHGITPQTVKRQHQRPLHGGLRGRLRHRAASAGDGAEYQPEQIPAIVAELEAEMRRASEALEFEKAAQLRDRILALKDLAARACAGTPPA